MGHDVKTEIVEFNGIAGCGKTTLAKELKEELIRKSYRAILFSEASEIFEMNRLKNMISCIKWPLLLLYLRLFLVMGRKKENRWFIYWASLKISLIYQWCLKAKEFDFVLADHGLIQNLISLLGFEELQHHEKFNHILRAILNAENEIYIVNCTIPLELSRRRIRLRNRNTGRGRLDVIRDDQELKRVLRITEVNFIKIRSIVNNVRNEWPMINLEMDRPTAFNVHELLNLII